MHKTYETEYRIGSLPLEWLQVRLNSLGSICLNGEIRTGNSQHGGAASRPPLQRVWGCAVGWWGSPVSWGHWKHLGRGRLAVPSLHTAVQPDWWWLHEALFFLPLWQIQVSQLKIQPGSPTPAGWKGSGGLAGQSVSLPLCPAWA